VAWASRTSAEGNTMMAGAPRFAEDGTGYGSHTLDYRRDELMALPTGGPPAVLATPPDPWHGAPTAAYGPLLVTTATGGASWSGPPRGVEVRCRADGAVRAPAGTVVGQPLLAGGAAWFFGDQLARYDVSTGALRWRVGLGTPPPPSSGRSPRPVLFRSSPLVTAAGAILFTEQAGTAGDLSSQQQLRSPVLRMIDRDGREVLRRELPLEPEAYDGSAALDRGRLFLGGQVLPSAGAAGVVRAFDLAGHDAAPAGWIVPEGSLRRDQRAR
jgi:hypothetical protein